MTGHFAIGQCVIHERQRWQIREYGVNGVVLICRVEDGLFAYVRPYYMQAYR